MAYERVGERIRERLLARGYRREDGEPNVREFAFDYRFDKGHLYAWMAGKMKPFKNIVELCAALDCSVEWLLTGRERVAGPKAPPRPGRGLRKLLLALTIASAALWPSGSASGQDQTLTDRNNPSYRKRQLLAA